MANTLYDYYTGQGQRLPSVGERAKLYQQAGLGSSYSGTAQQNAQLLSHLKGGGLQNAPTPQTQQTPRQTPTFNSSQQVGQYLNQLQTNNYQAATQPRDEGALIRALVEKGGHSEASARATVEGRRSSGTLDNLYNEFLGQPSGGDGGGGNNNFGMPEIPEAPNLSETYEKLRRDGDIDKLETSVNDLSAQERELESAFRAEREKIRGGSSFQSIIAGRTSDAARQMQEQLETIRLQKQTLVDELNSKYKNIEITMDLKKQDYQTAIQTYQLEYQQNLQIYDRMVEAEERSFSIARANWQTITGMMAETGTSLADLTGDQVMQIQSLEARAGLPVGFTQTVMAPRSSGGGGSGGIKKIHAVKERVDDSGNVQYDIIGFDPFGNIQMHTMSGGQVQKSEQQRMVGNIEATVKAFEQLKDARGQVSGTKWRALRASWQRMGHDTNDFVRAFSHYTNPYDRDFESTYGFKLNVRSSQGGGSDLVSQIDQAFGEQ